MRAEHLYPSGTQHSRVSTGSNSSCPLTLPTAKRLEDSACQSSSTIRRAAVHRCPVRCSKRPLALLGFEGVRGHIWSSDVAETQLPPPARSLTETQGQRKNGAVTNPTQSVLDAVCIIRCEQATHPGRLAGSCATSARNDGANFKGVLDEITL